MSCGNKSVWIFKYNHGWSPTTIAVVASSYEEAGRKFISAARPDSMTGHGALDQTLVSVERHTLAAERPAKCPPQPIGPDAPAAETARKMSGKASKFPSTMDAKSWAVRLKMHNTPESLYSVSQLTEWFQAALSFGYEEGRKAGASRTMTASQYLAWEQMNAAPPSLEAAPPCPEDLIESFDARVWAGEFMRRNSGLPSPFISSHVQVDKDTMITWFSNALMRGYDERRNVEAPFDEQRRQIKDSRRELVRDYRDLVARCMARIAELSEART